jgi:hypothetical protein
MLVELKVEETEEPSKSLSYTVLFINVLFELGCLESMFNSWEFSVLVRRPSSMARLKVAFIIYKCLVLRRRNWRQIA